MTTFLLILLLQNTFSLELHFNNQSIPSKINAATDKILSCFGLKHENKWIDTDFPLCSQTSCILMKKLKSSTFNGFCDDYMISSGIGSIAHRSVCPLQGTMKKIDLYLNKDYTNQIYLNKIFIIIDGCFNSKMEDVSWILSEHEMIKPTVVETMNGNHSLYEKTTSEDVYFEDFNRDCSKLCEPELAETIEVFNTVDAGGIESLILSIVTLVAIVVLLLGFYCLKNKFR